MGMIRQRMSVIRHLMHVILQCMHMIRHLVYMIRHLVRVGVVMCKYECIQYSSRSILLFDEIIHFLMLHIFYQSAAISDLVQDL